MKRSEKLVVFLGPSLPARQARDIAGCLVLPPARQGDVWRALARRPSAIALIDGVFEAQPSVWHRELLAAMEAGVAVFGAASMGALRAAELGPFGMVGVGQIFRWVRDGVIEDDSEVALLHADAEHGYRPLTLPLVNVRHAAAQARAAGLLSAAEARALVDAAAGIFYQARVWPQLLEAAALRWRRGTRKRFEAWAADGIEDLKAKDARECIEAAARFVAAHPAGQGMPPRALTTEPSSLVRRRRLREGLSMSGSGRAVGGAEILERLLRSPEASSLAERGLRRALLAGFARAWGLRVGELELRQAEREWLGGLGVAARDRAAFLAASGLDEAEARRLVEDLALERLALEYAQRLLPDGPSAEEGLAAEARIEGAWARVVGSTVRRLGRGN